jgi:hypothetical protein
MESNVSQSETDKNSYEVFFKFPNMTSMSIFMVEFDQFRKEQIKVTIKTQEKKSVLEIEYLNIKNYILIHRCSNV